MEKRLLSESEQIINPEAVVKLTKMNHIYEVQWLEKVNTKAHIRKLDAERYVEIDTGEIKEFKRTENRLQGLNSLRKTFNSLRGLINTNFSGLPNELFITLTYRGDLQTKDTKKIYSDYDKFMKRMKYRYKDVSTIDYINVLEPHMSGNFHMHVLMRFNDLESIYIPNDDLAKIWGNGFVTVKSLSGVDNIGVYLSAYLSDIEVPGDKVEGLKGRSDLVEKDVKGQKKSFLKGARLGFYPTGVNIYRKSKGIKVPTEEKLKYKDVQKKLGSAKPNFKYGMELIDSDKEFRNTLIKEQYNLRR